MQLSTDDSVLRAGRALLGFMSEEEAAAFVSSQTAGSWEELRPVWQDARAAYEELPLFEPQPPRLEDLPLEVMEEVDAVRSAPPFQQQFAGKEVRFALVGLEHIVAFQQFVDTQFSTETAGRELDDNDDLLTKVKLCLPREFNANVNIAVDQATMSASLSSLSRNLNIVGMHAGQVPGQPFALSFLVALGGNWVQVIEFEGRYFLKNGYHRVWLLHNRGDQSVPAIVTKATAVEEIGIGPGFFPPALILSERPPLFRHFFDARLAPELQLKSTMKVITFSANQFVLPRLP
jgi:hypothetical protein